MPDSGPHGIFALEVDVARVALTQGTVVTVAVEIVRSPDFAGEVTVAVAGLPTGATVEPLVLAQTETVKLIELRCARDAQETSWLTAEVVAQGGGVEQREPLVLRVTAPHGGLDATFGEAGVVLGPEDGTGAAHALVRLVGGALLVAGAKDVGVDAVPALWRYRADGTLDDGFGVGGEVVGGGEAGARYEVRQLAVAPDGAIALAGSIAPSGRSFVERRDSTGALDLAFGGGRVVVDAAAAEVTLVAHAVGGGVVVGVRRAGGLTLLAFDAAGGADLAFGDAGLLSPLVGEERVPAEVAAFTAEGRVLAGAGVGNALLLTRFDDAFLPDVEFGVAGHVFVQPRRGWLSAPATALALVGEGDALLCGGLAETSVLAVKPSGATDLGFGDDGAAGIAPLRANAIGRDGNGSTYLLGDALGESVVARLDGIGELELPYGAQGFARPGFASGSTPGGLAVADDGAVFAVGPDALPGHFRLVRIAP